MCKVYNSVGSLTVLKTQLHLHNIHDFTSLKSVIDFQNSYSTIRSQIISRHEIFIEQEKNMLQLDLQQLASTIESQNLYHEKRLNDQVERLKVLLKDLEDSLPASFIQRLIKSLKVWYYKTKIYYRESTLNFRVKMSIKKSVDLRQKKNNRYQYILSRFEDAVDQSSKQPLAELDRKKGIIDELSPFIYGALGEQKVVKVLEGLSDEYFLINDFSISFSKPIYFRNEYEYIKSIQIDHILIAPSCIFLIETKNWSEKSLENLSLRSPVQQIKRSSYVLFKLLNHEISGNHLHLDKHHWGDKKIPIRNLIVLTNSKPKEEFQYVKILTLTELPGYIKYFEPTFSNTETQRIADYLLKLNSQKIIL